MISRFASPFSRIPDARGCGSIPKARHLRAFRLRPRIRGKLLDQVAARLIFSARVSHRCEVRMDSRATLGATEALYFLGRHDCDLGQCSTPGSSLT